VSTLGRQLEKFVRGIEQDNNNNYNNIVKLVDAYHGGSWTLLLLLLNWILSVVCIRNAEYESAFCLHAVFPLDLA
jgi:hypothetical protein